MLNTNYIDICFGICKNLPKQMFFTILKIGRNSIHIFKIKNKKMLALFGRIV